MALVVAVPAVFLNSNYYYAKKLVSAIQKKDMTAVRQIVEKKPSCINTYPSVTSKWWQSAMDWRVCYPLNDACATGNIGLIELLIDNGADVNCNDGFTPLSITYNGKVDNWYEISRILIDNGASLDYITEYSGGKSSVLQDIVHKRAGAALPGYIPGNEEEVIKAFKYALENINHDNVDWGLGAAGPMSSFNVFSAPSKVFLSVAMLLGRLEIFPIFLALSPSTWLKN